MCYGAYIESENTSMGTSGRPLEHERHEAAVDMLDIGSWSLFDVEPPHLDIPITA